MKAVFLSAGVPDPKRGPEFAATADSVAISAAVCALIHVVLGRRLLIWGGHPAITPMIWVMAQDIGIEYGAWVRLYQSRYFEDEFPEDNARFGNVTYTPSIGKDRDSSLLAMRQMFSNSEFQSAVFIGGMGGIIDEFELLRQVQPNAKLIPVLSTGGAALNLASKFEHLDTDLRDDMDYVALFHRYLDISVREERYRSPDDQPPLIEDRFWKPLTAQS